MSSSIALAPVRPDRLEVPARRGHRGPALQRAARRSLGPLARRLWTIEVRGADAIPGDGPVILCANHLSFVDSMFLLLSIERPVHLIGKAEYLDSWTTRHLFPALGMIPVDRDSGPRAMLALEAAGAVLDAGGLLIVFPEGTRSRDGLLHRGHTGAARLALSRRCPIVPVGIIGTDAIQPPGARGMKLGRPCTIAIGTPLVPENGSAHERASARALTDGVMHEIAALSGQTYVDRHAVRPARPADTQAERTVKTPGRSSRAARDRSHWWARGRAVPSATA
jgi:1-acyl-sn-glycerol-3-phosphate acyltransferase